MLNFVLTDDQAEKIAKIKGIDISDGLENHDTEICEALDAIIDEL